MKTKLALLLVLIFVAIISFPSIVNQYQGVTPASVESSTLASPSKPEVTEELLVEGMGGENPGQAAEDILDGYELARQKKISSHANCVVMDDPSKRDGCHRYVNDQQQVPPYINRENSLENITANQCRAEITAYYEAVEKDMYQQAMAESVLSQLKKDWQSELATCNKYPYKVLSLAELQPIILGIEKTGDVEPEDLRAVLIDIAEKGAFTDAVARGDYIKNIENIFPRVTTAGSVDSVNCQLHKQMVDVLSAALAAINAFKQDKLELWSSATLQRKILLWKKLLLTREDTCGAATE
jgi:hypothetical protein